MNNRAFSAIGLVMAFLLAPLQVHAASATGANYEIELVVFRNLMPDLEGKEIWSPDRVNLSLPGIDQAKKAAESDTETTDIGKAVVALKENDKYQVLTHKRWIQTADARSSSPVMRISAESGVLDGTVVFYMSRFLHVDVNLLLKDTETENGGDSTTMSQSPVQPVSTAMGVNDSNAESNPDLMQLAFRIDESRRIRSNQMNYFDHPKFGVLLQITPVGG